MTCGGRICSQEKLFIFINLAFAMYSGALLSTAARLAWDPSTYSWFRFLCATQYRVSAGYVLGAGAWLAALVYLAAAAARLAPTPRRASTHRCLHLYIVGVVVLGASEVAYGAWMAASLAAWWRSAPEAELARRGADLLHDLKPALLAMERYRDLARPIYDMIEEMEHQAPNNVYVILVFGLVGTILQVAAVVTARRIARCVYDSEPELVKAEGGVGEKKGGGGGGGGGAGGAGGGGDAPCACDDDCDEGGDRARAGWRKNANLRMYTILDKIF